MTGLTFVIAGALITRWADTYWEHDGRQPIIYVAGCVLFALGLVLAVAAL